VIDLHPAGFKEIYIIAGTARLKDQLALGYLAVRREMQQILPVTRS